MDASLVTVDGYTVVRVAGRGGMGVVYEAVSADGRRVALKVIAPEHTDDVEFEQRFSREAKLAAQLHHPHIVPVIDSGRTTDGRPYLVFAYIDGTDLDHRLREHGALDPGSAARTIAQVAGALDAAHHAALVHRDVKPANVLIDRAGDAYLADFGLIRPLTGTRFTRSGAWLGTVDYASPEQIQGHAVDARSDIYALAAMTFQMLTGVVPFPRDSDMAKLWAHVNEDRPRLSPGVEHVIVLQAVIDRGMARDPGQRYLSAGDFAAALTSAAAGRTARINEHTVATGSAAPLAAPTAVLHTAASRAPTVSFAQDLAAPTIRLNGRSHRRRTLRVALIGTFALAAIAGAASLLGAFGSLTGHPTPTGTARAATSATTTPTSTAIPTPTATTTPIATTTPTVTSTPKPKPKPKPVASPRRSDDLPIVLSSEGYMPTRIGPWNPRKDASVRAAVKALGTNYTTSLVDTQRECILHWIDIGLRVHFTSFGPEDLCTEGYAQTLEIDGIISDRWRTLSGLRPDMPTSAIRKLYPRARKHGNAWWLITAFSPIGDGAYFAPITAKVTNGHVTGFEVWVGGAGD